MPSGPSVSRDNRRAERRALVGGMWAELRRRPEVPLVIALLWAWTRIVFETSAFDPPLVAAQPAGLAEGLIVLSNAAAYLLVAALFKWRGLIARGRVYLASIAFSLAAGAALVLVPGAPALVPALGDVLLGAGCAFFYVELGRLLGHCGPAGALAHTVAGVAGAAALLCALQALPQVAVPAYLVLAPLAFTGLAARRLGASGSGLYSRGTGTKTYVPWRLLVTAALAGMAFGVAFQAPGLGDYLDPPFLRNALTLAATAGTLLFTAVVSRMDFNQLIYRVGSPMLALGFTLYLVLPSSSPAGGLVLSVGYFFLDLLFWILLAHIINRLDVSANWIVALTLGVLLLGRTEGGGFFQWLAAELGGVGEASRDLSAAMVFALLVNALYMLSARNLRAGWGVVRPVEQAPARDGIDEACASLREAYGLTPREAQVCAMLSRGYSRKRISDELVVSEETARTHAANVFRKLGVHSHQELIALVERRAAALRDEG